MILEKYINWIIFIYNLRLGYLWQFHISFLDIKRSLVGFPSNSDGKASACSAGDTDTIPGSGRYPGEVNVPLKCIHSSNFAWRTDRGACEATVHGVAKSQTGQSLSD